MPALLGRDRRVDRRARQGHDVGRAGDIVRHVCLGAYRGRAAPALVDGPVGGPQRHSARSRRQHRDARHDLAGARRPDTGHEGSQTSCGGPTSARWSYATTLIAARASCRPNRYARRSPRSRACGGSRRSARRSAAGRSCSILRADGCSSTRAGAPTGPPSRCSRSTGRGATGTSRSTAELDALIGGSGSLLTLDELGVTNGGSTVMAKDVTGKAPTGTILTDGNRRQEAAFGAVQRNRSASLTPQEPYRADRRVHRYDQEALKRWTTTPELRGARSLTASSSQSDIGAVPRTDPSAQPWAAFDGDPGTAWRPDLARSGDRSWLRLRLDRATSIGSATIALDLPASETRQLIVSTESGNRTVTVRGSAPVSVPIGRVDHIEISARSTLLRPVAVSEVKLPGVALSRPLVMPTIPRGWAAPHAILMQGADGRFAGCLDVGGAPRCSDSHAERVEDDRGSRPRADAAGRPGLRRPYAGRAARWRGDRRGAAEGAAGHGRGELAADRLAQRPARWPRPMASCRPAGSPPPTTPIRPSRCVGWVPGRWTP